MSAANFKPPCAYKKDKIPSNEKASISREGEDEGDFFKELSFEELYATMALYSELPQKVTPCLLSLLVS